MPNDGYIEHTFQTKEDMQYYYTHTWENPLNLYINQYALLYYPAGELIDKVKWDGNDTCPLLYKPINNSYMGRIKPRNVQQELAFDMLQDGRCTIKLLAGKFGSGKSYLMLATALMLLSQNKFERIIYIRNNVTVKDVPEIGFLPGTQHDKLIEYAMPLADALGGRDGLDRLIGMNQLQIEPLGFIRGRDFRDSIIFCSESENLTVQHMQLLIGRVGDRSTLWLDGDLRQVDKKVFETNNGMTRLVERMSGDPHFGYVKLNKSERSETAALADLLD